MSTQHFCRCFGRKSIAVFLFFVALSSFFESTLISSEREDLLPRTISIFSNSPTRKKIDLAGFWQISFNGSNQWKTVRVPSSLDYEGESVFQRTFTLDSALLASSSFKLVAYGINNECEILINDIFIAKHAGGYTAFEISLPRGILRARDSNEIKIHVRNVLQPGETIPSRTQIWGWKNYHGILRDIFLLATPKISLEHSAIRSKFIPEMQQGEVLLTTTVVKEISKRGDIAPPTQYMVSLGLYDATRENLLGDVSTVLGSENREETISLVLRLPTPRLWTPEMPSLYCARVSLFRLDGKERKLIDQIEQEVGFVSVTFAEGTVRINGTKTFLKGIVWHEDAPPGGASLSYEQMEKDIALIKASGANAVRCAFHPPHPYIVNLCNRYGLLLLVELPIWEARGKELADEVYQARAEAMADEMIQAFAAAPSVLAWGIGSSFDSADPRSKEYVRRLVRFIQQRDSRLVYYGTAMLTNDVCATEVPLVGIFSTATDSKEFKRQIESWKQRHPQQGCVVLGYGREVIHENRSGYSDPLSQQAQARFFLQHTTALKGTSIAGGFIDAFADWKGEHPLLTVPLNDPTLYPRGLLTALRQKRLAFDVVRALYSEDRVDPIPMGNYKASFPFVHIASGFILLTFVGYLFTYNRHFGEALRRSLFRSYNFFEDVREKRGASPFHTALVVFLLAIVLALLTSSVLYYYRGEKLFDYLLTALLPLDVMKGAVLYAAWSTVGGIVLFTGVYIIVFIAALVGGRIITAILGKRFLWFPTLAVMAWGSAPLVFLIPVAMILFKILQSVIYTVSTLFVVAIAFLWLYVRILHGIAIIYEISRAKVSVWGTLFCIFLVGGLYLYYEKTIAISSLVYYLIHLIPNTV